ncbi:hypothetical protein [Buchnera aphidicola]|uniref:UPF0070 protein YfgM n=1 Tax=Buchnera aphidicola (Cinara laricifoliae) TaxID=2518977 RepID=A0A451DBY1_9GAMM|nr:hypothetical protein [Buchnera aphidicola]VFP83878.1 UPF0070 protein YfgM [Buchnera aphidicola (Cinara laricifoliae)]
MKNKILTNIKIFLNKYIYLILLFFLLSLSVCAIIINKNYKYEHISIKEFKKTIDNFKNKKNNTVKNKITFLNGTPNIYTILVNINLSHHLFLKKEYKQSISVLKKLISPKLEENLFFLVKFNLMKLYIKQKKFSCATKIVNSIKNKSWKKLFKKNKNYLFYKKRISE